MVPFAVFWERLKAEFATCQTVDGRSHVKKVQKWSAFRGDMVGAVLVVWGGGDTMLCDTETTSSPRTVSRAEFERIYNVWADYKAEVIRRSDIAHGLGVQNCTSIIPILYRHEHLMR